MWGAPIKGGTQYRPKRIRSSIHEGAGGRGRELTFHAFPVRLALPLRPIPVCLGQACHSGRILHNRSFTLKFPDLSPCSWEVFVALKGPEAMLATEYKRPWLPSHLQAAPWAPKLIPALPEQQNSGLAQTCPCLREGQGQGALLSAEHRLIVCATRGLSSSLFIHL